MDAVYHFRFTDGAWALDPTGEPFSVEQETGGLVFLRNAAGEGFAVPRAYLGLADEPATEE